MSQAHLLKKKRFLPLFLTQFLGAFNDNFLKNALVIWVTYQSAPVFGIDPPKLAALAGGIFILPFFLFSAQSGQLADKLDKARLTHWVKLAEIGIMILAAFGFVLARVELVFGALFLMGIHSTVFGPIKYGILPQHLSENELVGGNALIEAGTFLAILLGTLLGGILVSAGQSGLWIVSIGLVAVAILGFVVSLYIPQAQAPMPELEVNWNPVPPTIKMIGFAQEVPSVFRSILGISWFWGLGALLLSVFPTYCKDQLHAEEHLVTLFLAIFSIGIGLGSLLCERLSRHHLELGLVPLGSIGITLFLIDLFWVGIPVVFSQSTSPVSVGMFLAHTEGLRILFDLLMLSIFSGFFIVPLYALIQLRSEAKLRSRIIAANNIINALFMVLGSILLVILLKLQLNVPQILLVMAVLNAAVALYIYTLLPEFLLRFCVWGLANVTYRMKVAGSGNIPKEGPAILVCNHVSFVDWMIVAAGVFRPVRFIMHHSFNRGPMKFLVKSAKIIPIASAKEDPAMMQAALDKAIDEVKQGELICIFPEGKITHDGELCPFKPGFKKIADATGAPVIPMAIHNMWGSIFSRSEGRAILKRPRRFWTRISFSIGTPVDAAQATPEKMQNIIENILKD